MSTITIRAAGQGRYDVTHSRLGLVAMIYNHTARRPPEGWRLHAAHLPADGGPPVHGRGPLRHLDGFDVTHLLHRPGFADWLAWLIDRPDDRHERGDQ